MKNDLKTAILLLGLLAIWWFGKIGFGTFIVDPFMLYVCGYFSTYVIYRWCVQKSPGWLRRFFPLSFFLLGIFPLWFGGLLPYYDIVNAKDVYFGLLPQSFAGPVGGNDFMWNGLGVMQLFGRIVPETLVPTYRHFWFNALAYFVWFGMFIPVLGLGVLDGRSMSLLRKPKKKIRMALEIMRVIATGLFLSFAVAALTALVVKIYC